MKSKFNFVRNSAICLTIASGAISMSAQSYYDDDIYYDASKAKKENSAKQNKAVKTTSTATTPSTQLYYDGAQYVPWSNVGDYQPADSYQTGEGSMRDVDEYNRRYTTSTDNRTDSISLQQYVEMSNTEKLARFQQSEIAARAVAEEENIYDNSYDIYYQQPATTINVNVVGGYGYPYYYDSPWYWSSWAYSPWWSCYYRPYWAWGPSWSWNWGWGPSWGWGWGAPHWGYGPGWGGPHWGHNNWAHRPTAPGAYRPNTAHRPVGLNSSRRYSTGGSTYRNTGGMRSSAVASGRPATGAITGVSRPSSGTPSATVRPGYRQPLGSPSLSGSSKSSVGNNRISSGNATTAPSRTINNGSSTSKSGYNSGSSYRNNSSSGSYGGSRGGGYSSGGSHSGGRSGATGGGGGRRGR